MGVSRSAVLGAWLAACLFATMPAAARAQSPTDLTGSWTLNHQLSQFPTEIGFSASFLDTFEPDDTVPGGGRGRRRGGGGGLTAPRVQTETAEDAERVRFLTDEARVPFERLGIQVTPAMVTITPDRGPARTVHPGRRDEEVNLGPVTAIVNATWEDSRLVIVYKGETGRSVRYTYSATQQPRQLVVDVEFIERGGGDKVHRVYGPATALDTSSAAPAGASATTARAPTPPAPPAPAQPPRVPEPATPAPAAVDQRPDAALKGLTQLGVVLEALSPDAGKCGLKADPLEAAVTKHLTDAGFRVLRNSDDDTYLYVNVNTVSASANLCVSRYDVTLYSHSEGKLSYTLSPVLLQVELLHKGGIAGGGPAAHAEGVTKGVLEYVDQFSTRVRNANK